MESFGDSGLTEDEIRYIEAEISKTAERITRLPCHPDTNKLVQEYHNGKETHNG